MPPRHRGRAGDRVAGAPAQPDEDDGAGRGERQRRCPPQQPGRGLEGRLQQHEVAIALHHEGHDLVVALAGDQALAHQDAEVAGQRRVGLVDRLVLAHQATQLPPDGAGARLQGGIVQHLAGLDRRARPGRQARQGDERGEGGDGGPARRRSHAAPVNAVAATGRGAPIRSRRSLRLSSPPSAMISAPLQIQGTSGLW